jgi:adenine deaminase
MTIQGNIVDIEVRRIYPAEITVRNQSIQSIRELSSDIQIPPHFICPGFIDSHVHIESSMLVPSEFARLAVVHGTVATVSDPHEIANVLGKSGVEFMINNGKKTPFYFYFGAPSCVPATVFESAGSALGSDDVEELLSRPEVHYLSEMMNFPGVLQHDAEVMKKIAIAKKYNKPVDGHAPGLRGEDAEKYISAGISTDHECFTAEEALDKLQRGMKVLVREGSAARNFDALADLINDHWENMMFCSDDKHPDSLVSGHINQLCARARARGIDVFKILSVACLNPIDHYSLTCGRLRPGDSADFIILKDLTHFDVLQTWLRGRLVAINGTSLIKSVPISSTPNQFNVAPTDPVDFNFHAYPSEKSSYPYPVIEASDGQLITQKYDIEIRSQNGLWSANPELDLLKIIVLNRYSRSRPAMAFIKNFGLKAGALASSVAHDSHNIVAVGTNDDDLSRAINAIISTKGGISAVGPQGTFSLPLPVAGLMSTEDGYQVADRYIKIDAIAKSLGSRLASPFMTLSFMALLVIPHLKLSDMGLFDGDLFQLV